MATKKTEKQDIRIVILQRGWVVVGKYSQDGSQCFIRGGNVIRYWGTTRGLGEIAEGGPTDKTKLDPVPEVAFHELVALATIRCNAEKWSAHVRAD